MARKPALGASAGLSTMRFTMVGAANSEVPGQVSARRKISAGSKPPEAGTTLQAAAKTCGTM